MSLNKDIFREKFGKNLIFNESLSKYNWFNLGGPAELFFRPENETQLKKFLNEIKKYNFKITILGAGSNILVRDKGVKGIVIKLGSKFSEMRVIDNNIIRVGAAALDRKVSDFAKDNSLSGMEFLSCIPGSIGGAIIMNSGCYGADISKILLSIRVIDFDGNEKSINKDQIKFSYREIDLPKNFIILSADFKGTKNSRELIEKKQNEFIIKKKNPSPIE